MFILCDTSSILMLLCIAPEMFIDERFECITIREVHDEIVRNQVQDEIPVDAGNESENSNDDTHDRAEKNGKYLFRSDTDFELSRDSEPENGTVIRPEPGRYAYNIACLNIGMQDHFR